MTRHDKMIGYNRTVKLRWLDETVDLFSVGQSASEIIETLRERLRDQLSIGSNAERGSREKAITILLKTWVRVPSRVRDLRDDALRIIQHIRRTERRPLHWGMTMAVYPFWRTVADVTGRLFRLQGTAAAYQVQRRVKELFGEREAVSRSTRYVLRAFQDWGVIIPADQRGYYAPSPPIPIEDSTLSGWLVEAVLLASDDDTTDLQVLLNTPALFPFQLRRLRPETLTESGRLTVMRHGAEEDLVMLRKPASRVQFRTHSKN
jgi:hypothetical protein